MTLFSSGITMYVMGRLFQLLLGWDINVSIIVSAAVVLVYILLGGLTSSIYNEVRAVLPDRVRLPAARVPRR